MRLVHLSYAYLYKRGFSVTNALGFYDIDYCFTSNNLHQFNYLINTMSESEMTTIFTSAKEVHWRAWIKRSIVFVMNDTYQ
jgi:hypothetical protein